MSNDLDAILKDIDFGPVDKKLAAIGNLISMKSISLETVRPLFENIIAKTSDDSVFKFYALIALVRYGDHRDVIVDALISCLDPCMAGVFPFDQLKFKDNDGAVIQFPWLVGKVLYGEGDSVVAVVESLSHIHGSERVANILNEWLQKNKNYSEFIIYAIGAIGSPVSRPILEYYRDNYTGSSEGDAAGIALEHFGKATFFEILNMHGKLSPFKSKSGCFIATAVYGAADAHEVMVFRRFRDEVLLSSSMGRKFVASYYLFSPYVAKLIDKSNIVKLLIRRLILKPVMRLISYWKK